MTPESLTLLEQAFPKFLASANGVTN